MSDIYNKNAREKALLEEAYTNIYNEDNYSANDLRLQQIQVGSQVMWDGMMKRGQVEEVDLENGVAVVYDEDGGEHIVQLGDFDVILPVEDGEFNVDLPDGTNLKFDYDDGKKRRLGSTRPARTASERRLATAEGDYMVGRGDPRVKRPERTQFAISGDEEEPGPSEVQQKENHAKGVKMALEALEMFRDELHVDGHPEDVNVNELADAHDQLSSALHWLLDEEDVEYVIGGRATQRSEAQSQKEDFGGHDRESWHEFMRDYEEHGN